jgi:hypothetical protein
METPFEQWLKLHLFHLNCGSYETKDLAKSLGISRRSLERWITGKVVIPDKYQEGIKIYLDKEKQL